MACHMARRSRRSFSATSASSLSEGFLSCNVTLFHFLLHFMCSRHHLSVRRLSKNQIVLFAPDLLYLTSAPSACAARLRIRVHHRTIQSQSLLSNCYSPQIILSSSHLICFCRTRAQWQFTRSLCHAELLLERALLTFLRRRGPSFVRARPRSAGVREAYTCFRYALPLTRPSRPCRPIVD